MKLNQKLNILKAIGIIAVVAGHTNNDFFSYFPIYSYHMALFIFISGYFYKKYPILVFLKKKIKRLLIPFIILNIVYGILVYILRKYVGYNYGGNFDFHNIFIEPFITGHQFGFNLATWFIGMLFFILIVYNLLDHILDSKQYRLWLICIIMHIISLILSYYITTDNKIYLSILPIERVLFGLIFFQLGYTYRHYLEKWDEFSFKKLIGLVIFNVFLITFIQNRLGYLLWCMYFEGNNIIISFFTSCSGIWLFLQIAEVLKDKLKTNDILSKIGENTFSIMTHHLFCCWLLSTLFLILNYYEVVKIENFDFIKYSTTVYFMIDEYKPFSNLLYLIVGVIGPIYMSLLYSKIKNKLLNKA